MAQIGIVVPTIGQRPEYLPKALKSIREAGPAYILLVGNKGFDAQGLIDAGLIDQYIDEENPGLAAKINFGFRCLPSEVKFINWLGDDDLLTPNSLITCLERIQKPDQPVLVFGGCEYIDSEGNKIFVNRSGDWAPGLLRFGPQLIPQPGALYRRDAFEKVGGLNQDLGWAFDFELFLLLSQIGKTAFVPEILSKFRWHAGSLSVSRRAESVAEASKVRISQLPKILRPISFLWEYPVRVATYLAGIGVSRKLSKSIAKNKQGG
jgi:glycosyltransferase involved in cell wall biosynthesis